MLSLGIDVAKRRHNATLLDEKGQSVFRNFSFAHSKPGIESLLKKLQDTGQGPLEIMVGMEATGHYWMVLFQHLNKAGYQVVVINPIVTSARRNVTIRGSKTDSIDSALIAQLLRESNLRVSAVPEENLRVLRDMTRLRYECSHAAIKEKQRLIALLDLAFPEYRDYFTDIFSSTSRELLIHFPTAEQIARVDLKSLTKLLTKASYGRMGREHAKALKEAARASFSLTGNTKYKYS